MKKKPRKEQNVEKLELEKSEFLCFLFWGWGHGGYIGHRMTYSMSPTVQCTPFFRRMQGQ